MNSLLIYPEIIKKRDENSLVVTSSKLFHHISAVLNKTNSEKNQRYKITILNEGIFQALISFFSEKEIHFQIEKPLVSHEAWIDVIVGASRPQTMKKVLEHGTTYGIRSFDFFVASLSEKSYLTSKIFTAEKDQQLHDGLSQSARYYQLPDVKIQNNNPAANYREYDYKFVLDFEDAKSFRDISLPDLSLLKKGDKAPKIVLAIGPERGFREVDLAPFIANGFQKVTISCAVLRVEHALYSCLSLLEMLTKKY